MAEYVYPSSEWLEQSAKAWDSGFENKLKKLSGHYAYRIKAEPSWGIDKDLMMCVVLDRGKLMRLEHCSEEDAKRDADFIMAAEVRTWKRILRKLDKFVGAFMGGRIKLEKGNTVKALGLAPHANTLVESLTQVDLKFPDELEPDALEGFKTAFAEYRNKKRL
jgi:putative sterol carrier protein